MSHYTFAESLNNKTVEKFQEQMDFFSFPMKLTNIKEF